MAIEVGWGGFYRGGSADEFFTANTVFSDTWWFTLDGGGGTDELKIDVNENAKWPPPLFTVARIKSMDNVEKIIGMDTYGNPIYFQSKLDLLIETR